MSYIDGQGCLYDRSFVACGKAPAVPPFPEPGSFGSFEAFVDAVTEWAAACESVLGDAMPPLPVSRVLCRPRMLRSESKQDSKESRASLAVVEEEEASEHDSNSPRSPRLLSPRAARALREPPKKEAVARGAWRGVLVAPVPTGDDEETLLRWALLIEKLAARLPPHPADFRSLLGLGSSVAPILLDRNAPGPDPASTLSASSSSFSSPSLAVVPSSSSSSSSLFSSESRRRPAVAVWQAAIVRGERGWGGQEAPLGRVRAALAETVAAEREQQQEVGAATPGPSRVRLGHRPMAGTGSLRGQTPILSRIRPPQTRAVPGGGGGLKRNSSGGLAGAPGAATTRPRSATHERIAMVDLADSDEESDSVDEEKGKEEKEKQQQEEEEPMHNAMLVIDPIPNVPLGTEKAPAMARLRACRLLGNVFVRRKLRAMERGENFFSTPLLARIRPSVLLIAYPVLFSHHTREDRHLIDVGDRRSIFRRHGLENFGETLLHQTTETVATLGYFVPEMELEAINLLQLSVDRKYRKALTTRATLLSRVTRWDSVLSFKQPPSRYVKFEAVKTSLVQLVAANPRLTAERVHAWLVEHHWLDYWMALLQHKMAGEVVLVAPDGSEEKVLKAGTAFSAILFEGACFCLGDKTPLSGVLQIRSLLEGSNTPSVRYCLSALIVVCLPMYLLRVLPNASLTVLHFVCSCFSACSVDAPRLMPWEPDVNVALVSSSSDEVVSKLLYNYYVEYYLEYLGNWKGTAELSNEAYIGVRGIQATHLDLLKVQDAAFSQSSLFKTVELLLKHVGGRSPVLALHASFLVSRIVPRFLKELLSPASKMSGLPNMLFSVCSTRVRTPEARLLMRGILVQLEQVEGCAELFNAYYTAQPGVLMGHLTSPKSNVFVDSFLYSIAVRFADSEKSMMYAVSDAQKSWGSSKNPTSQVFNCIFYAVLSCDQKSEDIRLRLMALLLGFLQRVPNLNLIDVPTDVSPLVVLASRLSSEPDAHRLLESLTVLLCKSSVVRASFHPEKCRPAWRLLCDLCRGATMRFSEQGSDLGASNLAIPSVMGDASNGARPVAMTVHARAFGVVEAYMRFAPEGIPALISSRLLGTLLSAVAPHSPAGVAANALLSVASMLTLYAGEDVRAREKELKPLIAFLSEKRFHVQVHLLYRKQGADVPRNLYALVRWATTVLTSPLARELLQSREDAEYIKELEQIKSLEIKQ